MARDDTEFRDFVVRRWGSLVRYGYVLTGDAAVAEDLVQVALERCWRRWGSIRAEQPEAYVRTAVARAAISRFRALRARVPEAPLTEPVLRGSEADGADARADADLVWAQIATLPPRMRAVLVLRVYEDLSVEETARLLACSTGSVKSQLSRALDRLRACEPLRELAGRAPAAAAADTVGDGEEVPR